MNSNQKNYIKQLEQKIEQDDLQAKIKWANFYAFDCPEYANSDEIIAKIISYYEQGVLQEDTVACNNLGAIYYSGIFVKQDFSKAVELYTKASELGDSQAMCNLGYCFYYGRDIKVDYEKAFECFLLASLNDNANAMYKLGDMYLDEKHLTKNEKMAFSLYKKAYEAYYDDPNHFDADIAYRIAKCLFYGVGTKKDIFQAFEYIQTSEYYYYLKLKDGTDPFAEKLLRKVQKLKDEIKEEMERVIFSL
ncbi:MAG: tetratricopeptide repeat protein [Clostridia bacterium]